MFIHEDSKECVFGRTCSKTLCQFKHTQETFKENSENSPTLIIDKNRHGILPNDDDNKDAEEYKVLEEALKKIDNLLENKSFWKLANNDDAADKREGSKTWSMTGCTRCNI